jgi:hypothetical protein
MKHKDQLAYLSEPHPILTIFIQTSGDFAAEVIVAQGGRPHGSKDHSENHHNRILGWASLVRSSRAANL